MATHEIHLTVEDGRADDLAAIAQDLGASILDLDLSDGSRSTHLTLRTSNGFAEAQEVATTAARALRNVVRTKIEAELDAPPADGEPAPRYLELHVLVRLERVRLGALERIANEHGARLSRRARRSVSATVEERYVNQRADAIEPFALLVAALDDAGMDILKVHRERVLVDTNTALE